MNTDREQAALSNPGRTISMQSAFWNSLKMLAAAVLCGVAVSIMAAGIAIVLSRDAEARLIQKESTASARPVSTAAAQTDDDSADGQSQDAAPGPGILLTGDGCDGTIINALERDWQVRIEGNRVNVRVMQAFQMPDDSAGSAIFHVQLPQGARLRTVAAQTAAAELPAQVIREEQYAKLSAADYLKMTRNRLLVSVSPQATVMSSPIMNLQPEDIVTIQYTYEITINAAAYPEGQQAFALPLATAELTGTANNESKLPTKGALWVEWVGKNPSKVWGLPADASLESRNERIEGFSWATREIEPGAFLQLSWSM